MTYETRLLVRKVAEDCLINITNTMNKQNVFPVDIENIIKNLNGKIVEYENENLSDGYIEYTNKGSPPSFKIHLKKIKNNLRKRFTLAHELGHLILHMDFFDEEARKKHDENYYRTIGNYTEKELQADEFAASFLMPSKEFIKVASQNMLDYGSAYNVNAIAEHFEVSKLAVVTRGQFLGLFAWEN